MKPHKIILALFAIALFSIMIGASMHISELYSINGAKCTPINQSYVCVQGAK